MAIRQKGKISYTLQPISIIPLFFLGLLIAFLGSHFFTHTMYNEVELELKYVASNTVTLLDAVYPGDYELRGNEALRLYKGETDITQEYSLIDRIHANTDLDITVFYQDTRILTTIKNANGQRIVGTGAAKNILNDVLYTGNAKFYNNAVVSTETYFSYYMPLCNSDGATVGMLFVGKPRIEVDRAVQACLYPLLFAVILTTIVISFCQARYIRRLVDALFKIRNYATAVSAGNLDARLSESVLRRSDELGEIASSIQSMHSSLRIMVDQDGLTGLYNRRCANRKLHQTLQKVTEYKIPFCLALCDIDLFKKINDTYGHACGDLVLKQVAHTMKTHILNYGFVARWGGEEFLIVLEKSTISEAEEILENLRQAISELAISYEGQTVRVNITIGVTANDGSNADSLLSMADAALYKGKTTGRNRVITYNQSFSNQNDKE